MVSVNGTHLGHNLPDATGNRYCIYSQHPTKMAGRWDASAIGFDGSSVGAAAHLNHPRIPRRCCYLRGTARTRIPPPPPTPPPPVPPQRPPPTVLQLTWPRG